MPLSLADVPQLACPSCRGPLRFDGDAPGGLLADGALPCAHCAARWPVHAGLARLYREELVRGNDRLLRVIYDGLPGLHDPLTTLLTPLLQGVTERAGREQIFRRIDLASLTPRADRPLRILETGIGGGANLPLLRRDLAGKEAEIWGVDLSLGMLRECEKTVDRGRYTGVRLLAADAHALPFPDASFDRVFHVGGIGGYRDPRTALAEMARVAVRGTPIVVVDEQLDPNRRHSLLHRAAFRAITFWDPAPKSPRALLPEGACGVIDEQLARYYYCLTFRMPSE
jgi:ubiquinone/menaquinone biosynthesis C-methylase UbiE/uncharacterized protein YbaR (Trm112 family)